MWLHHDISLHAPLAFLEAELRAVQDSQKHAGIDDENLEDEQQEDEQQEDEQQEDEQQEDEQQEDEQQEDEQQEDEQQEVEQLQPFAFLPCHFHFERWLLGVIVQKINFEKVAPMHPQVIFLHKFSLVTVSSLKYTLKLF